MSCVTGFDKKRTESISLPLALALALGLSASSSDWASAQPYPPQYQQGPGQAVPGMPNTMPVGYPQGYPPQMQGNPNPQQANAGNQGQISNNDRAQAIKQWFHNYDEIRRKSQMNPTERAKADGLMSKAISMFIPGEEKVQAQKLLTSLVARYNQAVEDMKRLPLYPETEKLHRGYYQYFSNARQLFSDYLTVQQNPLATDNNGSSIAGSLFARKQNLEGLDQANKAIDGQLRSQFAIAPYQY